MKTKILIGIGLMISTLAFANNKTASKSEGTIKNDVNVNTLPVFTWERFSGEGMTGNSPFLIYSYLRENVEYPEVAMKYNIQGTAVVQFTVTAAGEVTNIKLVNSVCPEIDNEIVRVLKTTRGLWQPGLKNGKPADMEREVALVFQMNEFKNGSNDNLFKEQATTWFKKGSKALFAQNNPERALKYFDKALKYLPNESTILYSRGMAKHLLNDIKGAQDDWTRMYILTARSEMRNGAPMMTEIVGNNSPAK
jgi:TonB family protein